MEKYETGNDIEDFSREELEKLRSQIENEFEAGEEHVRRKRKKKLQQRKLYVREAQKDKVNINSIYAKMQVLLSLYYMDKMVVRFIGRNPLLEEIAEMATRCAEYDYEQMGLETVDYNVLFDTLYVGVGVKLLEGWNTILKCPFARRVDPLTCIPDPKGGYRARDYKFFGFEYEMTKSEMLDRGFDPVKVNKIGKKKSTRQEEQDQYISQATGYSFDDMYKDPAKYSVYWHFTIFDGAKYLCATTSDNADLQYVSYLEPETEEEKKDPTLVPFPFALYYYSPLPDSFYGISVVDLLEDKQSRYSVLFNLEFARAIRNAFGNDRFINTEKLKDPLVLKERSIEPRDIELKLEVNESASDVVYEAPKETGNPDAGGMLDRLKAEEATDVAITENSLGVGSDRNRPLGETEMVQQNANIRFGLFTKVSKWGEVDFWKLYYRSLQYNLEGEKVVRITRSVGDYYPSLRRDDIVVNVSFDVEIMTRQELKEQMQMEKTEFFATYATNLSLAVTPASKNYLMRKGYRLQGWSPEEIRTMVQETPDETIARSDVQRMNYGLEPFEIEPGQDHDVYINMYEMAIESDIKRKAIENRKVAKMMFAVQSFQQPVGDPGALASQANASGASMTASSIANMNKEQNQVTGNKPQI